MLGRAGLLAGWVVLVATASNASAKDHFLFTYFEEPAKSGVYYALSDDGYQWRTINDGRPVIVPQESSELMRDIFVSRGPDGLFHAVWTWDWREKSIGYANSRDLVHWSDQKKMPLMAEVPGTVHTWAPEIYWDGSRNGWLIIWSSITAGSDRNKIYSSFTSNFDSFTKPTVFFDPGYDVIDATIFKGAKRYWLIFKDQTKTPLRFQLRIAKGPTLVGPWTDTSEPFAENWSEGPSALKIGSDYVIYYDHYRSIPGHEQKRYEGVRSRDGKAWVPINENISFPQGCKHGSFLRITTAEARRLGALHTSSAAAIPKRRASR